MNSNHSVPLLPAEAFLLAGGTSRRFGSDKARFEIDGQPLILRVHNVLTQTCGQVTILAKKADAYQDLGLTAVVDHYPERAAIAGILTALELAEREWLFVTACDMPNLTAAFFRDLWQARQGLGVIPRATSGRHPLAAFYHRSSLPLFRDAYGHGNFCLQRVVSDSDFHPFDVPDGAVLANLNALPED